MLIKRAKNIKKCKKENKIIHNNIHRKLAFIHLLLIRSLTRMSCFGIRGKWLILGYGIYEKEI